MARRRSKTAPSDSRTPSHFPLDADTWAKVVPLLDLSPQQTRIVELLLQDMGYKQVAAALDIAIPTIRTQMGRIFQRLGVDDRVGLIIHVFTIALKQVQESRCHLAG